jgi:hypothetical protein
VSKAIRHLQCGGAVLTVLGAAAAPLCAQQDSVDTALHQRATLDARIVIEVDSLDRAAFANVAELLQARVPGLQISRTGDGGVRWFMRGPSSASESHPMVLVDDVRINVAGSAMPETGTRPPLLDEIDIEEVERIEIWSGAATTARYGTGAGNGVIRIVTTTPRGGRTSFRVATAGSLIDEQVTYPANFTRPGVDSAGRRVRCTLQLEATQRCTPTGPLSSTNPLETDSPFEPALAARVAASLASGTEQLAWRGGATFDRQGSTAGTVSSQRLHLRAATSLRPNQTAELTLRGYWTDGDAHLPPRDPSLLRQGLLARADTVWRGFVEPYPPIYQSRRYGGTMNGHWRPRDWLDASLTSGLGRMVDKDDQEYTVPATGPFPAYDVDRRGERRRREWNARLGAEARYRALGLRQATIATVEHAVSKHEEEFSSVVIQGGTTAFGMNRRAAIAGVGVRQRVRLGEHATLVGGIRLDQVRVNDERWDVPVSRHVSFAWDVPAIGALAQSRLRASLGDVANVPMTTRLVFVSRGPERPKAEFTHEREVGFDAAILENRVATSLTWYMKRTTNVGNLAWAPQPAPSSAVFEYIAVLNRGIEASVHAHILRTSRLSWEARAWYAYNHNEVSRSSITPLAVDRFGFGQIGFSGRQWVRPGVPLGAVQSRAIVELQDLDGDGLVDGACFDTAAPCEVVVASSGEFQPAHPPTSASLATSLRFGRLTLSALLDHRSGHVMHNATMEARCIRECQALYDPSTSLRDQAEAVRAATGFLGMTAEDASYTKLREVSLRFEAPTSWARALEVSRLEVSLAGRNVATWTDYRGLDPESTSLYWIPLAAVDNAAEPLPRRISLRLTVTN